MNKLFGLLFACCVASASAAAEPPTLPPGMRERAAQFLVKYEDPAARAGLIQSAMLRARADLEGFDTERKLDAATFEKLTRLRAEFNLHEMAWRYRCAIYPDCKSYQDDSWDRHIEAVDTLLGQGGYVHARSWTQSLPVRRIVNSLSRQLPANASLTTRQSNALLDELEDERSIYLAGYSDTRQRFTPFSNAQGMEVLYSYDVSTTRERMASARAYSQRIRAEAATVLNSRQLSTFNAMQDDALAALQRHLTLRQARRHAGS